MPPPLFLVCHSATKRRNLLSVVVAFSFIVATDSILSVPVHASCGGLNSVVEGARLTYPPIARAAHVDGTVILLARFDVDGTVVSTTKILGPEMLLKAGQDYIQALKANPYSGPRECPMVIKFRVIGAYAECDTPEDDSKLPTPPIERPDAQHIVITHRGACNYSTHDPIGKTIRRFHLW